MIKVLLLSTFIFLASAAGAQVPRKTIVEHFTNSNCGVCAYYNPFIYDTLSNYPDVLRIAFYPSSPYAACFFSMLNPIENDARTNFYNVYGGTPKLVVNGALTPVAKLDSTLNAQSIDSTNFAIYCTQEFITFDSVLVHVVVKKVGADTMSTALLFAGAAEDTVMQTTGNGEMMHQDVFRTALTGITGDLVLLPVNLNDSIVLNYSYKILNTWAASRMRIVSILQRQGTKEVINAAISVNVVSVPLSISTTNDRQDGRLFPNPVSNYIVLENYDRIQRMQIISLDGKVVFGQDFVSPRIQLPALINGFYLVKLFDGYNFFFERIIVQK